MKTEYALQNLKTLNALSQETTCFDAILTLRGEAVAFVSNRGCGGAHHIRPLPDAMDNAQFQADLAKREFEDGSLHSIIDDLLDLEMNKHLIEKAKRKCQRDLAKKVIFTRHGDKAGAFRVLKATFASPAEAKAKAEALRNDPTVEKVLNLLPFDEAFNLLYKFD